MAAGLAHSSFAFAQSITVQGKVTDSSGTPIAGSATQFRVQILTPDANRCVLYDETQTVDLSTTYGLFTVNLNSGLGTRNLPNTYSLEDALSNRGGFGVSSTYCASGSGTVTYTPGANDNRKIVIQFRDPGTMTAWETIPEMDLNPVPYAIEARTVGGFPATSLLRVSNAGVLGTAATLSSAQFTELQNLIGGTSNNYMSSTSGSTTGARLPTVSGNPSSPTAGSVWFDTGSGAMKYFDGSTVQTLGTGTGNGTITGVTAGTGLSGGGVSGTVTVSLGTSGVTAGSYGSATQVPMLTVDAYGRITSASTTAVTGVLPSGTSGEFLKSDGTSWSSQKITMADLKSTISGDLFSAPGCTAAQALYWDSGTDQIKCQNIAINASAITAGTIADARLADVGTAGTYKIVTTDGKGRVTSGSNPTTLAGFGITDAVLNAGGIPNVSSGALASRPAAASAGRLYVSTDNLTLYRDNGTTWDIIGAAGGGASISEITTSAGLTGGGTSGTVNIALSNVGTAGTYTKVTTDAQGRVTAGTGLAAADIPNLDWAKITSGKPTTLSGYGITDSLVQNAGNALSLQAGTAGTRPAFGTAGRIHLATDTGVISYDTGTAWVNLSGGTGSLTDVQAGTGINVTGTGATRTVTLANTAVTAASYGSATQVPTFTVDAQGRLTAAANVTISGVAPAGTAGGDLSGTYPNPTVAKLQGVAVASAAPTSGHFLKYNGANWSGTALSFSDLQNTSATSAVASAACSASQTLYYDTTTKELKCQSIGSLNASAITAGILGVANGGTGLSSGTSGGLLYFSASNTIASSGALSQHQVLLGGGAGAAPAVVSGMGTSGQVLTSNGPGAAPTWQSAAGGTIGGTGTTNKLPKFTGASTLGDSVIAESAGKIGIGTTGPTQTLDVRGGIRIANTDFVASTTGTFLDATLGAASGNTYVQMQGYTNGGTNPADIVLNPVSGKVGIGTTAPGGPLDVVGTGTYMQYLRSNNTDAVALGFVNTGSNRTWGMGVGGTGVGTVGLQNGKFGIWDTTAGAPRIVIDTSGNMGIGIVTPGAKLHVNGSLKVDNGGEGCTTAPEAGIIRYSAGNLQYCNGSAWQTLGVSGAGLTNLNGQTGSSQSFAMSLTGTAPSINSASNVHTVNIPMASAAGVTAGLISKTDYDSFNAKLGTSSTFAGDVSGTSSTTSVDKIKGVTVNNTGLASGQFHKYNGSAWVGANLSFSDLLNTSSGSAVSSAVCTAGQSMYYDTTTKELKCQSIAIDAAAITSGTINAARLPASASYWQAATGGINYAAGNVGINNGTPGAPLDVVNTSSTSGSVTSYLLQPNLAAGASAYTYLKFGANVAAGYNAADFRFDYVGSGSTSNKINFGFAGIGPMMTVMGSGNVGIGTTAPGARLSFGPYSVASPASTHIRLYESGTDVYGFGVSSAKLNYFAGGGDHVFHTGASGSETERMRITQSGQVAIGTTTATTTLTVKAPGAAMSTSIPTGWGGGIHTWDIFANGTIAAGAQNTNTIVAYMNNLGNGFFNGSVGIGTQTFGGKLHIAGATNGVDMLIQPTTMGSGESVRIRFKDPDGGTPAGDLIYTDRGGNGALGTSGAFGVGTSNPQAQFHVAGGHMLLDNTMLIQAKNSSGTIENVLYGRWSDNHTYLDGNAGLHLRVNNGAADALQINTLANVGLGMAPGYKLDVAGDIRANSAYIRTTGNTGWYNETHGGGWYMQDTTYLRVNNDKWVYTGGRMQAGEFRTNTTPGDCPSGWLCNGLFHDVTIASLYYSGLAQRSDRRLKDHIEPLADQTIAKLMQLRPVSYQWRDQKFGRGKKLGFIAQEVEQVLPELVETAANEQKTKSMDYTQLISPLVLLGQKLYKDVQELFTRTQKHEEALTKNERQIRELQAENATLKARLDRLEKALLDNSERQPSSKKR